MKHTIHNVATPRGRVRHRMTNEEFHGDGVTLCGARCVNGWMRDGVYADDPALLTDRNCPKCIEAEYEQYGHTCYFILVEADGEIPVAIYRIRHLLTGPAAVGHAIYQKGLIYLQSLEEPGLFDWYKLLKAVSEHKLKVPNVRVEKIALVHDNISTLYGNQLIL